MRKAAFAILILLLVAAGWWWITYLDEGATGPAIIGSAPPDVRVPVAEGVTEPVKLPTATPDATPETAGETAPIAVQPATGSDGTEVEIGQQAGDADAETASDAAVAGLGVTRLFCYQVASAISDKRLRLLLRDYEAEPAPVQFVYPGGRRIPQKLRALIDFALPRLKSSLVFDP